MNTNRLATVLTAAALLLAEAGCSALPIEGLAAGNTPVPVVVGATQIGDNIGQGAAVEGGNVRNPSWPAEIAALRPEDAALVCPRPQVGVDLMLTDGMLKDGAFDATAVSLTLDGKDITSSARITQPMMFPANRATLTYEPTADLTQGVHAVSVTYRSGANKVTHAWSFTVGAIPCP